MKKTILSIIMIMAVGLGLTAQENNDTATRELSKKEQKALEKKKKQQANYPGWNRQWNNFSKI